MSKCSEVRENALVKHSECRVSETPGLHAADASRSQMRHKDATLIQITPAVLTV